MAPDRPDSARHEPPEGERERLIEAFGRSAAEQGYRGLSLDAVARSARMPRTRLEVHFPTKERGLIAAQEAFLDRLWIEMMGACQTSTDWPRKVAAGLGAVLAMLTEASALARVFTVEASGASPAAAERHFAAIDQFASLLSEGREHYPRAGSLPEPAERILVGGIASVAAASLLTEEPAALSLQQSQLTEMLLIPYLGEEEARRIARD